MLLVERRELIETFVKETLELLDPEIYAPLALFLDSPPHFDHVRRQLKKVIKVLRRAPNKKKLLLVTEIIVGWLVGCELVNG